MIKLAGILDEHDELAAMANRTGDGKTLINLAGIERINSSGTRDWVNWLAALKSQGIRPLLIACSPAVVAQLNLVKNFAGNAVVKSVQVPFHCAACDQRKLVLVNVADLGAPPYKVPTCACDGCRATLPFVDETGDYFAFVSQLKIAPKAARGRSLARGSSAAETDESKPANEPRVPTRTSSAPYLSAFQVSGGKSGVSRASRSSARAIDMFRRRRRSRPSART